MVHCIGSSHGNADVLSRYAYPRESVNEESMPLSMATDDFNTIFLFSVLHFCLYMIC